MDPATRRLAVFAGAIGAALLLLVGVWSFTGHRQSGGVPVVEADPRPLRVKPADPGGLKVDGATDATVPSDSATATAAPPPETPAPQALKQAEQAAAPPAPAATAPPAPAATPAPVAPPAPKLATTVRPELQPLPAMRPHITVPAKPPATAQGTGGGYIVQLAALVTEQDAATEWRRLAHKYGDLLGGRQPNISRIEHEGKVFWRLRTGGFADATQAEAFCNRVKAKGGGCSIGRL